MKTLRLFVRTKINKKIERADREVKDKVRVSNFVTDAFQTPKSKNLVDPQK